MLDLQARDLLLSVLLGGLGVMVVSAVVPGVRLRGFTTAVVVGVVYGVLKALLQVVLVILTLPLVVLTFGLFIVVINAFLLWITDRVVPGFDVRSKSALVAAAFLLSIVDLALHLVVRGGAPF